MLIKQIALKNFRQYKDLQVVEFSCDKEKNVTVILGDNTSGKPRSFRLSIGACMEPPLSKQEN